MPRATTTTPTPTPIDPADLLSDREAAALLGVPLGTLRDWLCRGVLQSLRLGRHRRVRRSALGAWLAECEAATTPARPRP
jgi:excisionase family DNA binding protein